MTSGDVPNPGAESEEEDVKNPALDRPGNGLSAKDALSMSDSKNMTPILQRSVMGSSLLIFGAPYAKIGCPAAVAVR